MEQEWGLVFSGGGAKGAYEIGVWRALRELGWEEKITAVSGASVGSLNAVLFAAGDYERAENVWRKVTPAQFLELNSSQLSAQGFPGTAYVREFVDDVKNSGIFSREGLLEIMAEEIDWQAVSAGRHRLYANASYEHRGRSLVEYFSLNGKSRAEMTEILLASSAMPVVYEPVNINGILYRDGGVVDNTPVYPLARDGFEHLIIVRLDRNGYVEKSLYKNREVIEIVPGSDLGNFFDGTVDFSHENIIKRMEMGYYDALFTLRQYRKQKEQEKEPGSTKAGKLYTAEAFPVLGGTTADMAAGQAEHKSHVDLLEAEIQRNLEYIRQLEEKYQ